LPQPVPFGKYLLLDRISTGGMAEVFRAKSFGLGGFEKLLAIKRILPALSEDNEFLEMFIDEAKIAAQLSHANICQIFELGCVESAHYIAMEYVSGKDLLQIHKRFQSLGQCMPVAMAALIASRVCEGLDFAHEKKDPQGQPLRIIHRDVSPHNILVSYDGEVKLIDFGIAKAARRSSKTRTGLLKGKFGYMSPEQVRGLPLDRRSDIFAIGTVLYEMVTGEPLFRGDNEFSTLEKVRNPEIQPPSVLNPRVPKELEKIIFRALARAPEDRYQAACEMHEDLRAYLMAQQESFTTKRLSRWMKETFVLELRQEREILEQYACGACDEAAAGAAPSATTVALDSTTLAPPPPEMPAPVAVRLSSPKVTTLSRPPAATQVSDSTVITATPEFDSGVLAEVLGQLAAATGREDVARAVVQYFSSFCGRAVFFVMRQRMLRMQEFDGDEIDIGTLLDLTVPLEDPSALRDAIACQVPYHGKPGSGAAMQALARALPPPTGNVLIVPIALRNKVVSLVYGDRLKADPPEAGIARITLEAGLAYERIIAQRKLENA
jgi:eukaryotic-like serine/threonine-protein kinase